MKTLAAYFSASGITVKLAKTLAEAAIADKDAKIENYERIYLGFPIWWYVAPTIINTFLEAYDFTGKTVILFAASGSSDMGRTLEGLEDSCQIMFCIQSIVK